MSVRSALTGLADDTALFTSAQRSDLRYALKHFNDNEIEHFVSRYAEDKASALKSLALVVLSEKDDDDE